MVKLILLSLVLSGCSSLECSVYPNMNKDSTIKEAINDPIHNTTMVMDCVF